MRGITYVTRERVKQSLDSKETAANDTQVDRAVESASRSVEGELERLFYPEQSTYAFRRPPGGGSVSAFRIDLQLPDQEAHLFLDTELQVDLIVADSVTVDGTVVDPSSFTLLPLQGPPFSEIEFRGVSLGLATGRPIEIAGLWGYDNVTEPAGELAAAVATTTATTVDVSDSSATGVGSLLTVGTERMTVTGRTMLDTGETLTAELTASMAATSAQVSDGAAFHVGEVLLVDAERLLVVDISGNDLVVRRAWDGSVLGQGGGVDNAHASGTTVLALRRLTVERAVLGAAAATHLLAAPVLRQVYPGPVVAYTVALAQSVLQQEITGQGGEVGGRGQVTTLQMLRDRAVQACGRDAGFA